MFATPMHSVPASYRRQRTAKRQGKIVITIAVMMSMIIAVATMVYDGSAMLGKHRRLQNSADALALSTAADLLRFDSADQAISRGYTFADTHGDLSEATVEITSPPIAGRYAGNDQAISVDLMIANKSVFGGFFAGPASQPVHTTATAFIGGSGIESTLIALDPQHQQINILGIPALIGGSASLAGLEVEGLGGLDVYGAVHVNSQYGTLDEDGHRCGLGLLPPHGISVLPGLGLVGLRAEEIRVVGGVDHPGNYAALTGSHCVLKANRLPKRDPYRSLPIPSNSGGSYGGVTVVGLPLIGPTVTLHPGVYDWIQVVSGKVKFEPGIYFLTGRHPITKHSLALLTGSVVGEGVMFYIGAPAGAPATPDSGDLLDLLEPVVGSVDLLPSVLIAQAVSRLELTGINDPGSPYNNLLFFQERDDRRPLIIEANDLLKSCVLSGSIYAQSAHLLMAGRGEYDLTAVTGTMRFVTVGKLTLNPANRLPPADDIFLVE
ncbi:hypothetical protein FF011L_00240 [Roseimaritima multifibrata]|uniref:Putative Flp pilus-assembly TadG-like N-terminal domain-containing protein n=1 Tax=Roseimaritima multifibrata TaxID=1930274 RepID=A0A517M8T5_9BACT|nr:Tad domain-containing protein [Roseimaritima multifibrata]QDS91295.1 hypothetical protein FF011L_00240 [Roseimaritima multifibrata]